MGRLPPTEGQIIDEVHHDADAQAGLSRTFSSGPTKKHPMWTPAQLEGAQTGRSHRAKRTQSKITTAIDRMSEMLGLPADYRLGIVPASDTGAVEMAM